MRIRGGGSVVLQSKQKVSGQGTPNEPGIKLQPIADPARGGSEAACGVPPNLTKASRILQLHI